VIKRIVQAIRYRQFSRRYMPQLERFLDDRTPLLQKHYQSAEYGNASNGLAS
jgi:hypothetical protein